MTLHIDIETYSETDLSAAGMYRYAEDPAFEILLIAYKVDDRPTKVLDMTDHEADPDEYLMLVDLLGDRSVIKKAWNAQFERTCLARAMDAIFPPFSWHCTMVHAASAGLPLNLDQAAAAVKATPKAPQGKALIRYFCQPCKPTKANGGRTRNRPQDDPEKWEAFKNYCKQDVDTECEIDQILERQRIRIPEDERRLYVLDQKINDTGVLLDQRLVNAAIDLHDEYRERLQEQAIKLTGLKNPNSPSQLKAWLQEQGLHVAALNKSAVVELLDSGLIGSQRELLEIRQEMSKSSVKKYEAMWASRCSDGRVRGLLQFYGANRTGRWAGRLIQVQNLPQNHMKGLDTARETVKDGDLEMLDLMYPSPSNVLSQLVRTAFIAPADRILIAVDFSAIEARVIAWLAGEKWRLDVFNTHGKIYEASAAAMFKVPIEDVDKAMRAKGKIAELALGFGGSVSALQAMGSQKMGLADEDLQDLVNRWRRANRRITQLWNTVQEMATEALMTGSSAGMAPKISMRYDKGLLRIQLPSRRELCYQGAKLESAARGSQISYRGTDQTTKQWGRQRTYGGKLVENIVQATARDLLGIALLRLDAAGFKIIMHVHDEVVIEGQPGDLARATEIMSQPVSWAPGLPLAADGFEARYYQK
jgi:DNA polymerase